MKQFAPETLSQCRRGTRFSWLGTAVRSRCLGLGAAIVLAMCSSQTFAQATLFGAAHRGGPDSPGGSGPSTLYKIHPDTGAETFVAEIGFNRISGMDFSDDGILYATGERSDGTHVLITIDTVTGMGTEVGPTGDFNTASDISFRSDGVLFAYTFDNDGLALADLESGAMTEISANVSSITAVGAGYGFAFSRDDILFLSIDERLYVPLFSTTDLLFPAELLDLGFSTNRLNAMSFNPETGTLFGSFAGGCCGNSQNFLVTIDTMTGVVTLLGPTVGGLDAIAWTRDGSGSGSGSGSGVDHYRCSDVDARTGLDIQPVDLADQLDEQFGVDVGRAELHCSPVVKNDEGELINPDVHLTCYSIRTEQPAQTVEIENQFGSQTLVFDDARLLCVPSTQLSVVAGNLLESDDPRTRRRQRRRERLRDFFDFLFR